MELVADVGGEVMYFGEMVGAIVVGFTEVVLPTTGANVGRLVAGNTVPPTSEDLILLIVNVNTEHTCRSLN